MRWNCPHCKTVIAVSASDLKEQWSFTACFQCSGISLVRRNDINIIRVDRKPSGETILNSRTPYEQLNQTVMNAHAALQPKQVQPKQVQLVAKPMARADGNIDVVFQDQGKSINRELGALNTRSGNLLSQRAINTLEKITSKTQPTIKPISVPTAPSAVQDLARELEMISKTDKEPARLFSYALIFLGTMTLISGVYLFIQGKELWKHAQTSSRKALEMSARMNPEVTTQKSDYGSPSVSSVDQIRKGAMAPLRPLKTMPTPHAIIPTQALDVQAISRDIALLSGPGFHFSTVLKADIREKYSVNEIQDQWYKIWVPNKAQFAWVHHDWVNLMPKAAHATVEEDQFFEDDSE